MQSPRLNRRDVLQKCLALGSLTILSTASAPELIAAGDPKSVFADVNFELVMERL
jgi:hypothetical protein